MHSELQHYLGSLEKLYEDFNEETLKQNTSYTLLFIAIIISLRIISTSKKESM